MFQARFKITEDWKALLDGQWFPFLSLKDATIKRILSCASSGLPLDDLADSVAQETAAALPTLLANWRKIPAFADHLKFLEQGVERYIAGDFISTTSIIYPRIEGLLRSHQQQADPTGQATQKGLAGSAVKAAVSDRHASTPLLPDRFRHYLEAVYFAAFDPRDPKIKVSRNSVGHGVAAAEECSKKSATFSLLIVDQLSYFFSAMPIQVAGAPSQKSPSKS
jgi:hypothetical protein